MNQMILPPARMRTPKINHPKNPADTTLDAVVNRGAGFDSRE